MLRYGIPDYRLPQDVLDNEIQRILDLGITLKTGVKIGKDMPYEKVKTTVEKAASDELVRFYPVDRYSDESLGDNVSLSIRFVLQSEEKTLQEEDITSSMDSILNALNDELGVGLR
jgi:phenylalanyl-tRNA synthetase beta chain